jgi:putative transposase
MPTERLSMRHIREVLRLHYSVGMSQRTVARRPATRSNETSCMISLQRGHRLRVLTIADIFSRFSPALKPRFTFRGSRRRGGAGKDKEIGFPAAIRVDQGTEFVSRDLDLWAYQRGVTLHFSRPGKPTDNAFIEA